MTVIRRWTPDPAEWDAVTKAIEKDRDLSAIPYPSKALAFSALKALADRDRGAIDRLDDAIKAARLFNRSGMTWMEYDRKLAQLESFVNDQRGR
jgi:hypothetical protein